MRESGVLPLNPNDARDPGLFLTTLAEAWAKTDWQVTGLPST